jgi:small subunit ribosomal protein S5
MSSARVMIMPAPGRGMVAGSSVRNVLELAGIKNVRAKIISGSKNKLNNARAAIKALETLREKKSTKVI